MPYDICGDPRHDYRNCTKRPIVNPKMLGKVLSLKKFQGDSAQIVIPPTRECALVHGVINLAT